MKYRSVGCGNAAAESRSVDRKIANTWEDFIMSANPNACTTSIPLLAAGLTAGVITAAAAGSLGGPLELQDEGVFFVNGQAAQPGTNPHRVRRLHRRLDRPQQ
jgi:hypothetical protein